MYWFTLQHMFLSSWFLSSVFQTSKVKSKGWGNASVDLDEMRGNCRLLYGFYMLSIWFTIVIHYHSMYILPMNPQAAGPTTGWKTRRQTGMGMVGGWALSLPYLAFLKLKFGQFDYTRLTGGCHEEFPCRSPTKFEKLQFHNYVWSTMVNHGQSMVNQEWTHRKS